ncbi:MAG: nuclear transport factor 2 family protein, partial [Cyanobacteria bacterium P01_A01_bin.17]
PAITVNLPEQVKVGSTFNFDVVVDEPLDKRLLLGTAIEEEISPERYLKQPSLKLELLPAGGLFKVGKAPKKPTSEWISAVLVQDGGMVVISRRLTVVKQTADTKQSLLLTP